MSSILGYLSHYFMAHQYISAAQPPAIFRFMERLFTLLFYCLLLLVAA
jgi:hypothetical protein